MNFTDLIQTVNDNVRKTVNKIIKTQTKLSKCESAITFNGLCLKEYIGLCLKNQQVAIKVIKEKASDVSISIIIFVRISGLIVSPHDKAHTWRTYQHERDKHLRARPIKYTH